MSAYPEQKLQQEEVGGLPPEGAYPLVEKITYPPQQQTAYPQQQTQYPPTAQAQFHYPQGQGPPAYQQSEASVTVIHQPAPATVIQTQTPSRPETGSGALVFAMITTVCFAFFGCWCALPCTIAGLVFAITSISAGSGGDIESAQQQAKWSLGCTSAGLITAVIGTVVFFVVLFSLNSSASASGN